MSRPVNTALLSTHCITSHYYKGPFICHTTTVVYNSRDEGCCQSRQCVTKNGLTMLHLFGLLPAIVYYILYHAVEPLTIQY